MKLLAALALAWTAFAQQPSPDEILAHYLRAIGGRDAIGRVHSRVMNGTYAIPSKGYSTTLTVYAEAPGKYAFYMTGKRNSACRGFDGILGWSRDFSEEGLRELKGDELAAEARESDFYRDLRLAELYPQIRSVGAQPLDGHDAWVLEAQPAGGPAETWYFDKSSVLLLRRDVPNYRGMPKTQVYYDRYAEAGGVNLPHTIRVVRPSVPIMNVFAFDEIKQNVKIDAARFAKPAAR
jgi:hypothetical protein